MLRFLFSKLITFAVTLLGVTIVSFILVQSLPGDPIQAQLGDRTISDEKLHELKEELGLNDPYIYQYGYYLKRLSQGNFGYSYSSGDAVIDDFFTYFPATVELSIVAMFFATLIGLPLGLLASLNRGKALDYSVMGVSLTGYSMPIYWWAPVLVYVFAVQLNLFPVSGRIDDIAFWIEPITGFMLIDTLLLEDYDAFYSALNHIILPAIVLGTIPMAVIARMTRSSMLEVLNEDYIRTAYAKGLSKFRVVAIHALRNAMIPVITVIGLQTGVLMVGAILTETIFSWPGIGNWIVGAIRKLDYPIIQSGMLLIASVIIIVNFIVDLLYGLVNPRIRHAKG